MWIMPLTKERELFFADNKKSGLEISGEYTWKGSHY
jgi:hypothetical protein